MPTIAAQITVGDYAKWRPAFDKHKPLRDKAGLANVRVYRDADNPNELIVCGQSTRGFEWSRDQKCHARGRRGRAA